jgi:hypothetical protein
MFYKNQANTVPGISLWILEFSPRQLHVGFVVNDAAM